MRLTAAWMSVMSRPSFLADLRVAVHRQVFEMLADEGALESKSCPRAISSIALDRVKLEQPALLQVARADAGRVQRLHELERC
jgi:hypothetical protein